MALPKPSPALAARQRIHSASGPVAFQRTPRQPPRRGLAL